MESQEYRESTEKIFGGIMGKFLNLMKNINPQFKKLSVTQIKINRITPRHIIIRLFPSCYKKKLIKTTRKEGKKKDITQRGAKIRITDVWSRIIYVI